LQGTSITLVEGDEGNQIRVVATVTNDDGLMSEKSPLNNSSVARTRTGAGVFISARSPSQKEEPRDWPGAFCSVANPVR
jgi:hypothetical protein